MRRFTSNNFKDILLECQKHQDLEVTCWNGRFQCNGFLFVTIFPGLTKVLHFENSQYDNPSIIVPDVDVNDLHCFFNNIYSESPEFYPGKSLLYLLSWKYTSSSITPKHVKNIVQENVKEVIKEELDLSENIDTDVNDGIDDSDYPTSNLQPLSPSQSCPVKIGIIKSNQPVRKRHRATGRPRGRPIKIDKVIKTRFHCDQCSTKSFPSKTKLEAHIKYIHEGVPRPKPEDTKKRQLKECDKICECGIDFKNQDEKLKHYRIVHKGRIECPDCERVFKEHLFASHKCESNKKKEKEGGVGICPHCGISCKTHGNLHYHKFVAHSTGSFPCDICGKIYTNVVKLKEHLKKTCKAQMIPCSICGAMLKGQRGIKGHMRSVHMDDKDKRYQCDICGKGFFSQDKLKCHEMSMHIKSRPHRCRYGCDIGYNDISNRNAHEKKTHGERYDLFIKNPK